MGEGGYKIRNKAGVHFVTFAVAGWVDVLPEGNTKILWWIVCGIVNSKKVYCYIVGA